MSLFMYINIYSNISHLRRCSLQARASCEWRTPLYTRSVMFPCMGQSIWNWQFFFNLENVRKTISKFSLGALLSIGICGPVRIPPTHEEAGKKCITLENKKLSFRFFFYLFAWNKRFANFLIYLQETLKHIPYFILSFFRSGSWLRVSIRARNKKNMSHYKNSFSFHFCCYFPHFFFIIFSFLGFYSFSRRTVHFLPFTHERNFCFASRSKCCREKCHSDKRVVGKTCSFQDKDRTQETEWTGEWERVLKKFIKVKTRKDVCIFFFQVLNKNKSAQVSEFDFLIDWFFT